VLGAAFLIGPPASADRGGSAHDRALHTRATAALHEVQALFGTPDRSARTAGPTHRVDATLAIRDLAQLRSYLSGADRAAADALLSRDGAAGAQDDPSNYLCDPAFCVHWRPTGPDAPPAVDVNPANGVPDQVDLVLSTMEHVRSVENGQYGFRLPLADAGEDGPAGDACQATLFSGCPVDPNTKFDVYLQNLGPQVYGACFPVRTSRKTPAFCALDNDFAEFGTDPVKALQVTAAHEYFHAVQFAYDQGEARWFMEGSAVWMEDVVYNGINDYLQYVPVSPIRRPFTPFTTNGQFGVYGSFTIFKFLTSYLRDPNAVRQAWNAASIEGRRTGLQAITLTLTAHHRTPRLAFAIFGAWNTLPNGSYPEAASYRPAAVWKIKTLGKRSKKAGTWRIHLAPLANAPVVLQPGRTLSKHSKVRISVNAPNVRGGGAATLQVRYRDGRVSLRQFGLNKKGDRTRSVVFNPKKVGAVIVVLTNGAASGPAKTFRISAKAR
jgi:hypothetical protein